MKNYLNFKNTTPVISSLSTPTYNYLSKRAKKQFVEWINKTYPNTYADVKEGDYFIVFNGDSVPVPFVQLADEIKDKRNRPTRLLDGSYYGFPNEQRVRITTKEEVINLKKEILIRYKN